LQKSKLNFQCDVIYFSFGYFFLFWYIIRSILIKNHFFVSNEQNAPIWKRKFFSSVTLKWSIENNFHFFYIKILTNYSNINKYIEEKKLILLWILHKKIRKKRKNNVCYISVTSCLFLLYKYIIYKYMIYTLSLSYL